MVGAVVEGAVVIAEDATFAIRPGREAACCYEGEEGEEEEEEVEEEEHGGWWMVGRY